MTYENILFYKPNMVVRESFFYLFDYTQKILVQKRSNGGVSFQYPVSLPVTFTSYTVGEVICLQYDGYNFWTLQLFSNNSGILIRRWLVDNFICKLIAQFPKVNTGAIKYSASTFSVEHYNTHLTIDYFAGSTYIIIDEYTDSVIFVGTTIGLSNEKYGTKELVVVSYIDGNLIYLVTPLHGNFYAGDLVVITPAIFLFNNYYLTDNTKGSLIMIDPISGLDLSYKSDIEFLSITASKFCRLTNVLHDFPDVHTLAYVKSTNLKLRDMRDLYRYKATLRGSDSFDGVDAALPDSTRWATSFGDPTLLDNQLYCDVAGSGHDRVLSTYNLVGDFSVQVVCTFSGIATYSGVNIENKAHQYMGLLCNGIDYTFGFNYSNTAMNYDTSSLHLGYTFSGNANDILGVYNGTLYSSPTLTIGCDGVTNNAYSFNGSSYIQIAGATALELGKNGADFSLVFWLKLTENSNNSTYRMITRKGAADAQRTFAIWQRPDNNLLHVRMTTTGDANLGADTLTPLLINTWYMISYVKSGTKFYTYINDFLDNSANISGSVVSNVGPIYIGRDPWYSGAPCCVDNYMLFNRALDLDFIRTLFYNYGKIATTVSGTDANSQFNTYTNGYKYLTTTPSGVSFPYTYLLKAERAASTLNVYYNTLLSGTPQGWIKLDTRNSFDGNCSLSLGLHAAMVTTSGCYFNDLQFSSGYLTFPLTGDPYYGTLGMDNVKVNQSTIIPVYAIDIEGDNLYRLQNQATYYGTDYTWSTYNFQISPIRSFIDFITVDSDTHVLPATGRNTAIVKSLVFDQYGQGVVNRPITFTDDDPVGFITIPTVYTDIFYNTGKANTAYTSGTALRIVNIIGSATQVD